VLSTDGYIQKRLMGGDRKVEWGGKELIGGSLFGPSSTQMLCFHWWLCFTFCVVVGTG
jgi:hypothetical protein